MNPQQTFQRTSVQNQTSTDLIPAMTRVPPSSFLPQACLAHRCTGPNKSPGQHHGGINWMKSTHFHAQKLLTCKAEGGAVCNRYVPNGAAETGGKLPLPKQCESDLKASPSPRQDGEKDGLPWFTQGMIQPMGSNAASHNTNNSKNEECSCAALAWIFRYIHRTEEISCVREEEGERERERETERPTKRQRQREEKTEIETQTETETQRERDKEEERKR